MQRNFTLVLSVLAMHAISQPCWSADSLVPVFVKAGADEFAFDTGVLRGKLHADGKSKGLSSVVHVPTGMRLDASMGLFSHYRAFSAGKRYGVGAWDWPSEAKLQTDGSVEVRWPATTDRPFEMRASYRWAAPNILDLETSVRPQTNLLRFESFLASYFSAAFTNSLIYVADLPDRSGQKGLLPAEQSRGVWQAFPRDDSAVPIITDGRWKLEPNPVDWTIMPHLAAPVSVRRVPASGLTAVLMSPPTDCFAICTPHQTEPHYSMYLSLFGRDLKPGETARARTRLLVVPNLSDGDIVKAYESYKRDLK